MITIAVVPAIGILVLTMLVGGCAGCGLMALRHAGPSAHVLAESVRRDEAIRALARRQAAYVQNTFGTPLEREAREVGAEIYRLLDTLPTEAPNGR